MTASAARERIISGMRGAVILLILLALPAQGHSVKSWQRGEPVENPRSYSADARFCFVARIYDRLGDFDAKPAEVVFRWDEPEAQPAEPRSGYTGALYGGNHLIGTFAIPDLYSEHVLISESGAYVVATPRNVDDGVMATVFRADGTRLLDIRSADVLTSGDLAALGGELRPALSVRDEMLIVHVPASVNLAQFEEVRVDLATGRLLDEKRDICPVWRTWATGELAKQALFRPDAEYPELARRARIAGTAIVEVVIGANGSVTATRVVKPLPFGIAEAAEAAAKQWVFAAGKPISGRIEFHFRPVSGKEWREILAAQ